jgi:hypothetical protein
MSDTKVLDTPKESLAERYLATSPDIPNVCQPGDKECLARLIQAYSDCD